MAPVLKTGRAQALVGSNPTPSAHQSKEPPTAPLRVMDFGGKSALQAVGVKGGDGEVHRFAPFYGDRCPRFRDRLDALIVARYAPVIDIVAGDVVLGIRIPRQGHIGSSGIETAIVIADDDVFAFRVCVGQSEEEGGNQGSGSNVFLHFGKAGMDLAAPRRRRARVSNPFGAIVCPGKTEAHLNSFFSERQERFQRFREDHQNERLV